MQMEEMRWTFYRLLYMAFLMLSRPGDVLVTHYPLRSCVPYVHKLDRLYGLIFGRYIIPLAPRCMHRTDCHPEILQPPYLLTK